MKISTDVKLFPEEPDALIGHVRVCGGSGEVTPRFYPAKFYGVFLAEFDRKLKFPNALLKQTASQTHILSMRPLRVLKQGVWYEIRTRVNNREPLFRLGTGTVVSVPRALFAKVFRETKRRFVFEIRGLRLVDDWLTFYI
jgi:hypothetical protein